MLITPHFSRRLVYSTLITTGLIATSLGNQAVQATVVDGNNGNNGNNGSNGVAGVRKSYANTGLCAMLLTSRAERNAVVKTSGPVGLSPDCYNDLAHASPALLDVTDNDSNVVSIDSVTQGSHGSVVITTAVGSPDKLTYTPVSGYSGQDTFTYSSGNVMTSVNVFVLPQAVDDYYTIPQSASNVLMDVVVNDLGNSGMGGLQIYSVDTTGTTGSVLLQGNQIKYTPQQPTSPVSDSFTYIIYDAAGQNSYSATVHINVAPPPVANDDGVYTLSCGSGPLQDNVLSNDTYSNPYSLSLASSPALGTANFTGNLLNYTPYANSSGADSFSYQLSDAGGNASALVNILINPTGANDTASVAHAGTTTGNVLSNDCGTGLSVIGNSSPSKGSVTVNANGSFSYQATAGQSGADSFTYTLQDGNNSNTTATVNINIATPGVTANADNFNAVCSAVITGNVLSNDVYGASPTVNLLTGPSKGSLTFNSDGTFTYSPGSNYSGSDSFTYRLSSGPDNGSAAVNLSYRPMANNDSLSVAYASNGNINVISNDCGTTLTSSINISPSKGILTALGNGLYRYTANAGQTGADSFNYTITDSNSQQSQATVNLTIASAPQFNFFYNNQQFDNSNPGLATGTGVVQNAYLNQTFGQPLIVRIVDTLGAPVSGMDICFTAIPNVNGASATLSPTHILTNANGIAQVTATANNIAGTYQIRAELCGAMPMSHKETSKAALSKADLQGVLSFQLRNLPPGENSIPVPTMPWHGLWSIAGLLAWLGVKLGLKRK
ncbi:MAG: hypothetical protein RLZZ502_409 [Pseudomonadota bacterium]